MIIFFKHVNVQFCVQSAEQKYIGFLFYYLTVNVHVSFKILYCNLLFCMLFFSKSPLTLTIIPGSAYYYLYVILCLHVNIAADFRLRTWAL